MHEQRYSSTSFSSSLVPPLFERLHDEIFDRSRLSRPARSSVGQPHTRLSDLVTSYSRRPMVAADLLSQRYQLVDIGSD
jgi:hypothetical protein